jgi:import inner membrane translocase subunit TIM44
LFHVSGRTQQKESAEKDAKTPPAAKEGEQEKSTEPKEENKEEAKEEAKEEKEGDEKAEGKEKEKKEDLPPPPPHGDKTPWQVFLETMDTELKQSKEWNESTKALASSANDFVESERVRKARQAYEATSGAVSSTAAKAVKSTAGVIGKGATWTWDTPVMKGVRKGANKTGEALDKATKPIRETEAYRNVKDVIDDGSSSRYGGWVDKEERKRRRELREQMNKKNGVDNTVHDEDPK